MENVYLFFKKVLKICINKNAVIRILFGIQLNFINNYIHILQCILVESIVESCMFPYENISHQMTESVVIFNFI